MTTTTRKTRAAATAAQALAAAAARQLELTTSTHGSGALFNIEASRIADMRAKLQEQGVEEEDMPNLPIMNGTIQNKDGVSIPVSVFREAAKETGEVYASLSLGGKGKTHYYGKLFRSKDDNGPHYSGFILVLPVNKGDEFTEDQWADAPRLQVCGWKRRSANGMARISLAIAPKLVADSELAI